MHRQPLAGAEEDPELARWLENIPPDVRRTLYAGGLEPALARLLRDRTTDTPEVELLARRQAIELHLQSLQVQLEATTFEADCTGDTVEAIRSSIEQSENQREIRWTVLSIAVGAVSAVVVGAFETAGVSNRTSGIAGVVGGVAAGTLGLVAFVNPAKEIILPHERNLLAPIAKGEDRDHRYPSFVFRLLTTRPPGASTTPLDELRARFEQILAETVEPHEYARATALLYGPGGVYDQRLLEARERMLDELESTVAAFSRDFELLQRYLSRTLAGDCLVPSPDRPCGLRVQP